MSPPDTLQPTPFGRAMREEHFRFGASYVPMNHGSYGTAPKQVRESQLALQAELEERPDAYLRYGCAAPLLAARRALAGLLKAEVADLVLVQNATTAYNTVLRALRWRPGDVILHYEACYGSLVNTVTYLAETTPVRVRRLPLAMPCPDDDLVAAFETEIRRINATPLDDDDDDDDDADEAVTSTGDEGRPPPPPGTVVSTATAAGGQGDGRRPRFCRVRLVLLDTVTSMPGLRVPFERIVALCRSLDVLSLVDGAHGVGMLPLDLGALDADFFTTNLHKWLHVPRGCAALHVAKRNQHAIRSTIPTSWGFVPDANPPETAPLAFAWAPTSLTRFEALFEFVGTIDSQNYLTVPEALRWRREACGGEERIMAYVDGIARSGGDRVAQILGTDVMDAPGSAVRDCAFANVRMPFEFGDGEGQVKEEDIPALAEWIFHHSHLAYDSYFQAIYWRGAFWLRLSGQVYLDMQDFEWTARRVKEMCELVAKGRHHYIKDGICRHCAEAAEKARLEGYVLV